MRKLGRWYTNGERRSRHVFLLIPKTVHHNDKTSETRWWEWADIIEEYDNYDGLGMWHFKGFSNS